MQKSMIVKRIVDVCMTVLLLCLIAYQVTGEVAHEWVGIGMTVMVIVHQILNRKWYAAIFKGRYNAYRIVTTIINILLILTFLMTAFCGMSMSGYAVPFMYGIAKVSFARQMHLSLSHWAFVLMGMHLGLHIPLITASWKLNDRVKIILAAVFCCIAGAGLYFFLKNGLADYMFFRVPFAFMDYEKSGVLVFLENILMLIFWAFIGAQAASVCRKKKPLRAVVFASFAIAIGLLLQNLLRMR